MLLHFYVPKDMTLIRYYVFISSNIHGKYIKMYNFEEYKYCSIDLRFNLKSRYKQK